MLGLILGWFVWRGVGFAGVEVGLVGVGIGLPGVRVGLVGAVVGVVVNNNVVFKAVQQFVIASILDVTLYHSTFGMKDQLATLDKLKELLTKGHVRAVLGNKSPPNDLGAVRVWPLYALITGDSADEQTLKDGKELDRTAGVIFMDRKEQM